MTPMTHQFQKFNYAQSAQCHFCNSKFLDNNFKKIKFHSKLNTLVANENFFWTSEKVASSHFKSWTESEFLFGSCIARKCLFRVLLFGICENRDATMNLVLTVGKKFRIQRRFWMNFCGMIYGNCRFDWLWSFDLNFDYCVFTKNSSGNYCAKTITAAFWLVKNRFSRFWLVPWQLFVAVIVATNARIFSK